MRRRFLSIIIKEDGVSIPDNEIWYTSVDGNLVNPDPSGFNTTIISNTYLDGKGIIIFADSVTSIGDLAFYGFYDLTSVHIPNSVESMETWVFTDCFSLTSVTISNSITSIREYTFSGCSSLTSITIPEGVTSIEGYAFYDCTGLTSITCEAIIPPAIHSNAFMTVSTSTPVYVPAESVDAYKAAQYWSEFTNIQAIEA